MRSARPSRRRAFALSILAALAVIGAACSSSSHPSSSSGTTAPSGSGSGPWGWPGNSTIGYLPPHEPHVRGKSTVTVGLITAGDIHDRNYYQSESDAIGKFAAKYHWKTIIDANVNPAQALQAAETMCSEQVDLLVIGESELAAAGQAASMPVCKGTPVWSYASAGTMNPSPYYYMAEDFGNPQGYAAGYAMALWMQANHQTTAGFIGGPHYSFVTAQAQAIYAGMRAVIPEAHLVTTYTGDFNASGPALTAAQAMVSKGIKIVWPYLGGSFFPTAQYLNTQNVVVPSDGGDFCNMTSPKFVINTVFDPGYYLNYSLQDFVDGKFRVGIVKQYNFGITPIPTVQFCPSSGLTSQNGKLNDLMHKIGAGQINVDSIIKSTPSP